MKIYNNIKLSVKSAFFNLMVLGLIVLPATLFTQENPFIFMENNKFYHQCEEFYPVFVNYRVEITKDLQDDFHIAPYRYYCTPNDCVPTWYSCGTNFNEWHDELKVHLEKIVDLKFNTIRLLGLGISYDDDYMNTGDEVLKSSDIYVQQQSDPNCYITEEGLIINDGMFEHQGDLLQELIDIIKNNDIDLKLIILIGGSGVEMLSDDYSAYLSYMSERFKDEPIIFGYDLYNEPVWHSYPQNPSPDKYERTETCLQWYNAIKLNAPSHFVTIGSERFDVFDWDPGILPVDFISFHLFYDKKEGDDYEIEPAKEKYKVWLKWMSESFNLPIYIYGETGFPGINTVPLHPSVGTEEEQKEWAEFSLKYTRWYGTEGYSWWFYKDVTWYNNNSPFAVSNYKGIVYNENDTLSDDEISKPVGTIFENYDPYIPCTDCSHPDDETYYNPNPKNYTTTALDGHVQRSDGTPVKNVFIQGLILDQSISVNGNEDESSMAITNEQGDYLLHTSFDYFRVQRIKFSYPGMELKKEEAWNTGLTSPVDITIDDLDASQIAQKPDLETYTIEAGETETWDVVQFLPYKNIIIEGGAQLNITSNIFLLKDAKITVKRSGKLKIDRGRITCSCGLWKGIEVHGVASEPQNSGNQGMVQIINGGTIENASCGIKTYKPVPIDNSHGPYDFTGGIVIANSANFINNTTAVKFLPYSYSSMSLFDSCYFETNDNSHQDCTPDYFIKMTGMNGIRVQGCTFKNTWSDPAIPIQEHGSGIYAINTQFIVDHVCISQTQPCSEYQPSAFTNLEYGIYSTATTTSKTPHISNSTFTGNGTGIYLSGTYNATVITNDFYVRKRCVNPNPDDIFGGLYLDHCTGFEVEENNFFNDDADPIDRHNGISVGLVVNHADTVNNEIYNNSFENLNYGTIAQDVNRNSRGTNGLQIKCNDYEGCENDIAVTSERAGNTIGIKREQGSDLNEPEAPANNTFSYTWLNQTSDYYNECEDLIYWYPFNDGGFNVVPINYSIPEVNPQTNEELTNPYIKSVSCPSHLGTGGGIEGERSLMSLSEQKADSTQNLLNTLVDGGDTETLDTEVQTSLPEETLILRDELLAESPYLSDTVMVSATNKENVLDPAFVTEILSANPQAAKSDTVQYALDNRVEQLTGDQRSEIDQGWFITGAKESLESRLSAFKADRSRALNDILRHFRNDTISPSTSDSIIDFLQSENQLWAEYSIAFEYFNQKDSFNTMNTLNAIPNNLNLNTSQSTQHQLYLDYFELMLQLNAIGKSIFQADSANIDELYNMYNNATGMLKTMLRNVLIAVDTLEYNEPYIFPNGLKSGKIRRIPVKKLYESNSFKMYPNPAQTYVVVEYSTKDESPEGYIRLLDNGGKTVKQIALIGNHDFIVIPLQYLPPGIYIFKFVINNQQIKAEKLVISR